MSSNLKIINKIGYGAGSFYEAGFYNFPTSFLLIYLTTIANLSPDAAGTICSVSILMEAVSGVTAGHISDQFYSKFGRRRPFIIGFGLIGCVSICLLFLSIDGSETTRIMYYFSVAALFWAAYSFFYIPYTALGAIISYDYHERVTIRTYCRVFAIAGNLVCTVLPLWIISILKHGGIDEKFSWFIFVVMMSVVAAGCCFLCWRTTRGLEPVFTSDGFVPEKRTFSALFRDYLDLLKLKCFSILAFARTILLISYAFYTVSLVYFMKYKAGFDDNITPVVFLTGIIASLIYTPIVEIIGRKLHKQTIIILSFFVAGSSGVIISIFDITGTASVFIYVCLMTFAHSTFWQVSYSMVYDLTEVDEFKHGLKREGSIASLMSLLGTLAVSLSFYFVGHLLKNSGFNSETIAQNDSAITMIGYIYILIPCILLIIAGIILIFYPMSNRRFEALKKAIELRQQGKDIGDLRKEIEELY